MGFTRYTDNNWMSYRASTKIDTKSVSEIYTQKHMHSNMDPKNINIRESKDSEANPESNAIIIALDVTGSMNSVLNGMIKEFGTLFKEAYDRKPVSDPHILLAGIGDVKAGDSAPLQATQFESDICLADQLQNLWLENGGGGNLTESYELAWYFANTRTEIDCLNKRNKKGYLFTVGDEGPQRKYTASQINRVFGCNIMKDFTSEELRDECLKKYNIFHIIVQQGFNYQRNPKYIESEWRSLLSEKVLLLPDYSNIPQVVVSAIQLAEGMDYDQVLESWGEYSDTVEKATINLRK